MSNNYDNNNPSHLPVNSHDGSIGGFRHKTASDLAGHDSSAGAPVDRFDPHAAGLDKFEGSNSSSGLGNSGSTGAYDSSASSGAAGLDSTNYERSAPYELSGSEVNSGSTGLSGRQQGYSDNSDYTNTTGATSTTTSQPFGSSGTSTTGDQYDNSGSAAAGGLGAGALGAGIAGSQRNTSSDYNSSSDYNDSYDNSTGGRSGVHTGMTGIGTAVEPSDASYNQHDGSTGGFRNKDRSDLVSDNTYDNNSNSTSSGYGNTTGSSDFSGSNTTSGYGNNTSGLSGTGADGSSNIYNSTYGEPDVTGQGPRTRVVGSYAPGEETY